jgi:hypothetical protein
MKNKIFLGGTCAETTWREELIRSIQVDFFNPVVENWTEDCIEVEDWQKRDVCNIHLYVITKEMKGVYSIAEVIDSTHTNKKVTILHVIPDGFDEVQLKSLKAVVKMVRENGGIAYIDEDLMRTARVINGNFKETSIGFN